MLTSGMIFMVSSMIISSQDPFSVQTLCYEEDPEMLVSEINESTRWDIDISNYVSFTEIKDEYVSMTCEIGEMYDVSPSLLISVIEAESGGKANIVASSGSGASGLCQIKPDYQKERMSKLGVIDIFDPYSNILVCCDYLRELCENTVISNWH